MKVILNGDDFGRSASINEAVIRAHRQGVLTSASLMVAGEAAAEAVDLARATPTLAVGLHLVVAGGRAVLPPAEIPHIVNVGGRFRDNPAVAGLQYFFGRTAQAELAREMEAQFERYAAYGLPLAHVDGHLHMHVHPTVFDLLVPLAERYGAGGLRLPHDDFWLAMGHSQQRALIKTTWAVAFGLLTTRCRKRLGRSRLAVADRVYGLMQTGQMEEAYVLKLLAQMRVPTAEIYFHPSLAPDGDGHDGRQVDLEALLSPAVRRAIQDRGLRLATYATLGEE